MAICNKKCANIPPTAVSSCEKELRSGGILHLVFARCDVQFKNFQDPKEWCDYVKEGKIVISPTIVGQKPKGNFTTKLRNSCAMEDVSGLEQMITFQDHNADTDSQTDFDFWQRIQSEADFLQFGWISCEGHFYGFVPKFTVELGYVIEETNLDSSFWDGSIMWQSMEIIKPQYIFNLASYLQGNCDEVINYNDCIDPSDFVLTTNRINICNEDEPQLNVVLKAPFIQGATYTWYYGTPPNGIQLARQVNLNEIEPYQLLNTTQNQVTQVWVDMEYNDCQILTSNVIQLTDNRPNIDSIEFFYGYPVANASDGNAIRLNYTPQIFSFYKFGWKDINDPAPMQFNMNSNIFWGIEDGQTIQIGIERQQFSIGAKCTRIITVTFDLSQATQW